MKDVCKEHSNGSWYDATQECHICAQIAELEAELETARDERAIVDKALHDRRVELAALREALDLIIKMDNQMFTLGDACSVAIDAVTKAGQGRGK